MTTTSQALLASEMDKKDNEARKSNAILYGLTERDTAMQDVTNLMCKELFKNFNKPVQAVRLGPKTENKNRPIKLRFEDERSKWEFLKRVNHALRADSLFCKLDMNKETRDKEYTLRQQVKKLKEEQPTIQFRIRDFNIQKKADSGNWEKVKPEDQQTKQSQI